MKKSLLLFVLLLAISGILAALNKAGKAIDAPRASVGGDLEASTLSLSSSEDTNSQTESKELPGLGVLKAAWENLTDVRITDVSGNYYVSDEEVLELVHQHSLNNLWSASESSWNVALSSHPWIKDAQVDFHLFPLRARIKISEIEPWLIWRAADRSWLVSRSMKMVQPLDAIKDPETVVELSSLPRVAAAADDKVLLKQGLEMIRTLELAGRFPFEVSQYLIEPDEITVEPMRLGSVGAVRISIDTLGEAKTKLEQLRTVIADLDARSEQVSEIDLRVRGQVIVRRLEGDDAAGKSRHEKTK